MKVSVPILAPFTPPETGASTKDTLLAFALSDICLGTEGFTVELSIIKAPAFGGAGDVRIPVC